VVQKKLLSVEIADHEGKMYAQYCHPVAAPKAGWTNLVACLIKPPVTGLKADISATVSAIEAVSKLMKI
jgi:hypothetical protein